jgi:hypothetical protein
MSDRGFRGKAKESQRALEGPAGRTAYVPAEGLLAFDRSTAFSRRLHNGNRIFTVIAGAVGVSQWSARNRPIAGLTSA